MFINGIVDEDAKKVHTKISEHDKCQSHRKWSRAVEKKSDRKKVTKCCFRLRNLRK